jgi:hypothetical protein
VVTACCLPDAEMMACILAEKLFRRSTIAGMTAKSGLLSLSTFSVVRYMSSLLCCGLVIALSFISGMVLSLSYLLIVAGINSPTKISYENLCFSIRSGTLGALAVRCKNITESAIFKNRVLHLGNWLEEGHSKKRLIIDRPEENISRTSVVISLDADAIRRTPIGVSMDEAVIPSTSVVISFDEAVVRRTVVVISMDAGVFRRTSIVISMDEASVPRISMSVSTDEVVVRTAAIGVFGEVN